MHILQIMHFIYNPECDGSLPEGLSVACLSFHSFAGNVKDKDPMTVVSAAH